MPRKQPAPSRRRFLAYIAGSPLLIGQQSQDGAGNLKDALNVTDLEPLARRMLPPAHYGYMATGVEDDATLKANRQGFDRIYLRPRRLIDIPKADLRTRLFGTEWETPIALAPVGNQKAFHPEGEMPVARAARAKHALQILSTAANSSVEDIRDALGRPPWFQLYPTSRWDVTERLVKRAEAAGCPVLALTVDTQAGRRTETFERLKHSDQRQCSGCHGTTPEAFYRRKPMFTGIDVTGLSTTNLAMTWDHLRRLRKLTSMKLLVKGIETGEDTQLAADCGVDGVIVSNHGGRAEESGRGTIDCLPEVVDAAKRRFPVLIDGGFRRGTDIFKALALGASGVCIGRPYIWGLAAFGQPGVERVLEMLRFELDLVMRQCGTRTIEEIGRSAIGYHRNV